MEGSTRSRVWGEGFISLVQYPRRTTCYSIVHRFGVQEVWAHPVGGGGGLGLVVEGLCIESLSVLGRDSERKTNA